MESAKYKVSLIVNIVLLVVILLSAIVFILPLSPYRRGCMTHDTTKDGVDFSAIPSTQDLDDNMTMLGQGDPALSAKDNVQNEPSSPFQVFFPLDSQVVSYLMLQNVHSLMQQEKPFIIPLTLLERYNLGRTALDLIAELKPYAESGVLTVMSLTELLRETHVHHLTSEMLMSKQERDFSKVIRFLNHYISVEKKGKEPITALQITWHNVGRIIKEMESLPSQKIGLQSWLKSAKATVRARNLYVMLEQAILSKERA